MIEKETAAVFALRVYDEDVRPDNLPITPDPWIKLPDPISPSNGFGYVVLRNESTKDVVISYRGTDSVMGWDGPNNIAMYLGIASSQAKQAAAVYAEVARTYPDSNITFTGHSLGGGIASVMAVLFDRPAIVFDPAPFEFLPRGVHGVQAIIRSLEAPREDGLKLIVPDAIRNYDIGRDFLERERWVQSYYAAGEFLQATRTEANTIYAPGGNTPVQFGHEAVGPFTMHSQALLTAGLLSKAFADATTQVQTSLPLIMSEKFYSPETAGLQSRNFLMDLIRSEQGAPGSGKLTHLAADLQRLGTNLAGLSKQAQHALVAQAVEWYHWQGASYAGQEFFGLGTGVLQYTTARGDSLPGALDKAAPYAKLWLNPDGSSRTALARAAADAQWNVVASTTGAAAVARDGNRSQLFVGNGGDDVFTGGNYGDVMLGGAGADTYIVGAGKDFVQDNLAGEGQLVTASGAALGGGEGNGKRGQWVGREGETYTFAPRQAPDVGTLTIANLGAGNDVTVEKFDYSLATNGTGYLGIRLDNQPKVALVQGGAPGFWRDFNADASTLDGRQATVLEGLGRSFSVLLNRAASAGDSMTLNLANLAGKGVSAILGSTIVNAEGAVIPLAEGQTQVSFALVQDGGLDADAAGSLSVTYQSPDGNVTSNEWGLTLRDPGATSRAFVGDQRPPINADGTFAWNETQWTTDGTLLNGVYEADFADVLYATTGNDKLDGRGGNDAFAAGAGHDVIEGGAGDDLIGGGSGSDVINGGDGNDFISSSGNSNAPQRVKTTDAWLPPAGALVKASGATWGVYALNGNTVWQGMGASLTSADGDVVDAGAGNDAVIAGWGDDRVKGGDGNDEIDGHAGDDVLEGGFGDDFIQGDGSVRPGLLNSVSAPDHGADFLDGGDGADVLLGGGNADQLFGGAGNDQIAGDSSGPTGSSAYVDPAWHGSDYLDGEDGDDYLEGGAGEDTLYGGADNDVLWGDTSATFVTLAAHNALIWANDSLDGGDGNDTLIGGGKDDSLYGGPGDDKLWGDERTAALAPEYHGEDSLDGEEGADFLEGGGKADTLFGGAGNDTLWGDSAPSVLGGAHHGDDYLEGGDGDDNLVGNGGADMLIGGAGADILLGDSNGGDLAVQFHGDDYLDGGDGDDLLLGDGGNDVLEGGTGNDRLQGGTGDDELSGGDGHDILLGEEGNDWLAGGAGDDQLAGGLGDDLLEGGDGMNRLFGQEGNDTLVGGSARDYLTGGLGDDHLSGGGGDDLYFYSPGDGVDRITDSGGFDRLVFANIGSSHVDLGVGSLKITVPGGGEVHLDDFDPDQPFSGAIELFQFTDGTFTRQQLIESRGFRIKGTPREDELRGTALGDRIEGYEGADVVTAAAGDDLIDLGAGDDLADAGSGNDTIAAGDGDDYVLGGPGADLIEGGPGSDLLYGGGEDDRLFGGAGDDLLAGGSGTDLLEGGDGNDAYEFGRGDGQDTVIDTLGANWLQLRDGLTEAQLKFARTGNDLILAITGSEDRLTVRDWFSDGAADWRVALDNGSTLDRAAVDELLSRNQPPILVADAVSVKEDGLAQASGNALDNDADPDGLPLRVTNPGEFSGARGSLTLDAAGAFTYTLENDSAAVQSLAEGQTVTETFSYTATDDDPAGAASASSSITVTIQGTNDAPTLGADPVAVAEDDALPVSGNVLANDHDVDGGTALQVAVPGEFTGSYGTLALAGDGGFSYRIDNTASQVQSLGRNQQATDGFGYLVNDGVVNVPAQLLVSINGRNDAPTLALPLPDLTASTSGNTSFSWQVPAGSFVDVDAGDTLTYGASLADGSPLPSWLAFDPASQTFSGRVPRTATGFLDIQVVATDRAAASTDLSGSLSTADVFRLSFDGGSGGGGGGGGAAPPKGNEGVGNGEDGPPPGLDSNFNDGPGTAPGDPGARGGFARPNAPTAVAQMLPQPASDAHTPPVPTHIRDRAGALGGSDQAAAVAPLQRGEPGASPSPETSADRAHPERAAPIFAMSSDGPDGGASATGVEYNFIRHRPAIGSTRSWHEDSVSESFLPQWAAVDERLLAHLAVIDGMVSDGAAGVTDANLGYGGGFGVWRDDPLASGIANSRLPVFHGLKEGLRLLGQ